MCPGGMRRACWVAHRPRSGNIGLRQNGYFFLHQRRFRTSRRTSPTVHGVALAAVHQGTVRRTHVYLLSAAWVCQSLPGIPPVAQLGSWISPDLSRAASPCRGGCLLFLQATRTEPPLLRGCSACLCRSSGQRSGAHLERMPVRSACNYLRDLVSGFGCWLPQNRAEGVLLDGPSPFRARGALQGERLFHPAPLAGARIPDLRTTARSECKPQLSFARRLGTAARVHPGSAVDVGPSHTHSGRNWRLLSHTGRHSGREALWTSIGDRHSRSRACGDAVWLQLPPVAQVGADRGRSDGGDISDALLFRKDNPEIDTHCWVLPAMALCRCGSGALLFWPARSGLVLFQDVVLRLHRSRNPDRHTSRADFSQSRSQNSSPLDFCRGSTPGCEP